MYIDNINDHLIEKKCYICFDPCDVKSPCGCDVYVHLICLIKFANKNNKNSIICTICKKEIKKLNMKLLNNKNYYNGLYYFIIILFSYLLGIFSIILFTNVIFNYNLELYIKYRINIIIHLASILVGFLELKLLYVIFNPCINWIKINYVQNNRLQIEN